MGKYLNQYTSIAIADLRKHKKAENKATLNKISKLITELENHPFTGTGQPEELKYGMKGLWSRRINQKDRLIYEVINKTVVVEIVSAMGHFRTNKLLHF